MLKLGLNAFVVSIFDSSTMVFQGKTRFPDGLSRPLPCIIVGTHALLLHSEPCCSACIMFYERQFALSESTSMADSDSSCSAKIFSTSPPSHPPRKIDPLSGNSLLPRHLEELPKQIATMENTTGSVYRESSASSTKHVKSWQHTVREQNTKDIN